MPYQWNRMPWDEKIEAFTLISREISNKNVLFDRNHEDFNDSCTRNIAIWVYSKQGSGILEKLFILSRKKV